VTVWAETSVDIWLAGLRNSWWGKLQSDAAINQVNKSAPHLTLLYPFVKNMCESVHIRLVRTFSRCTAFDIQLDRVGTFGNVVWLGTSTPDQMLALSQVLWKAFPDLPPYNGQIDDPQPHVTIAEIPDSDARLQLVCYLQQGLAQYGPTTVLVNRISVTGARTPCGRWQVIETLPLIHMRI